MSTKPTPCSHTEAAPNHESASGGTTDYCEMRCRCGLGGKSFSYHMSSEEGKIAAEALAVEWWELNVVQRSTEVKDPNVAALYHKGTIDLAPKGQYALWAPEDKVWFTVDILSSIKHVVKEADTFAYGPIPVPPPEKR